MERFHFRTEDQTDYNGVRLASLAAAKCEAAKVAASSICAAADEVWRKSEWTVTVTDDVGRLLFELKVIGTEAIDRESLVTAP